MTFASDRMALGYATARPAVHEAVLARARAVLGLADPLGVALDVGCGAGRSTRVLAPLARLRIGVDPAPAMIAAAAHTGGASFARAAVEHLPLRAGSCDLVAAAGSLPFADLHPSLAEVARVLAPAGVLVVYDYGPPTDASDPVARWWQTFLDRWPPPAPSSAVTPETLAAGPLVLAVSERMVVELPLDLEAYVAYVMTETNVERACEQGVPIETIRAWCAEALRPVLADGAATRFEATLACLVPPAPALVLVGGRERRAIEIAAPSPEWPRLYAIERDRIAAALGARARRTDHIGSTAVPGLAAKPIVDILVAVDDVADPQVTAALVTAGYPLRVLEPDHRMFRTDARDVHLHLWRDGGDDVRRHLLFRDWLRRDPDDRERYEAAKRGLTQRDWADMNEYADAKSDVIGEISARAETWARAGGWSLDAAITA